MTVESTSPRSGDPSDDELLGDAAPSDGDAPPAALPVEPAPAPRRRRRKNAGRWLGLGLIVGIVALVASTVRSGSGAFTYSKYVDEVMATPQRFVGHELRVEGMVEAGSLQNTAGSNRFLFRVERNRQSMPVEYTGVVPDTFREGIGVTVRGRLGASGTFTATEVVAKCPSKYEMQTNAARGATMPGMGSPAAPR